jgi:hypothetical protein
MHFHGIDTTLKRAAREARCFGGEMVEGTCDWAGCGNSSEAILEGRPLCRNHFHEVATMRLKQFTDSLRQVERSATLGIATLKLLSELISQTTTLVVHAKFLSPWQQDQLRDLSRSALELYKRIQRNPRIPMNVPIVLYREAGIVGNQESTNTINVSKRGACVATIDPCLVGERIWLQKTTSPLRTLAIVAWSRKNEAEKAGIKKSGSTLFHVGVELMEQENFWGLDQPLR